MVSSSGIGLEAALSEYYRNFFQAMEDNVVSYVLRRLPDMIAFWQSPAGQALHGTLGAAAIVTRLQNLNGNARAALGINKGFI